MRLRSLLDSPILSRIRRNHGLEHATLHILSRRFPGKRMAGHSNPDGFWILGDLDKEELRSAVDEALLRLNRGEHHLAVHPNCGTNLVVAGTSAGLAGVLAMGGAGRSRRDRLERLPLAVSLATFALIFAQPLGNVLQKNLTTSGEPGGMKIVDVVPKHGKKLKAHRVVTEG